MVGRRLLYLLILAVLVTAVACDDDAPEVGPAASPSATLTDTLGPDEGAPDEGPVAVTDGSASVDVTGELDATFEVPLDAAVDNVISPPPGKVSLTWSGPEGSFSVFAEPAYVGSASPLVVMRIGEPAENPQFQSDGCTVTIERLDPATGIDGSFTCVNLKGGDVAVSAEGTFTAAP